MGDFKHLLESMRSVAVQDNTARIAHLRLDRWIDYPRAAHVLKILNEMLDTPERNRMPCLLVHGDSGMGKSMIIEKFKRAHPPIYDRSSGVERHPVIVMEMPAAPSQRRFYAELLQVINAPYSPSARIDALEFTTIKVMRTIQPRMLIVDEIHNLLAGSPREQRAALNLLKFLSNQLNCCVVVAGTADAVLALQSDDQMVSRFRPFELSRWRESDEFRGFVQSFEKTLPIRQKSGLGDQPMVQVLLEASGGLTWLVAEMLTSAARAAIRSGSERITVDLIRAAALSFEGSTA